MEEILEAIFDALLEIEPGKIWIIVIIIAALGLGLWIWLK
jgi:hypothetical protein